MNAHHAQNAVYAEHWVHTASGAMTMAIDDWKPWDVVKHLHPTDAKLYFQANIQQLNTLQFKIDHYKFLNTVCINDITRMEQDSASKQLYEHAVLSSHEHEHAVPSPLRCNSCDGF